MNIFGHLLCHSIASNRKKVEEEKCVCQIPNLDRRVFWPCDFWECFRVRNFTSHCVTQFLFVVFCSSRKAEMRERHDEIRKKYGKLLMTCPKICSVYFFYFYVMQYLYFF